MLRSEGEAVVLLAHVLLFGILQQTPAPAGAMALYTTHLDTNSSGDARLHDCEILPGQHDSQSSSHWSQKTENVSTRSWVHSTQVLPKVRCIWVRAEIKQSY